MPTQLLVPLTDRFYRLQGIIEKLIQFRCAFQNPRLPLLFEPRLSSTSFFPFVFGQPGPLTLNNCLAIVDIAFDPLNLCLKAVQGFLGVGLAVEG